MQKTKIYLIVLVLLILPGICFAADLDALKLDFLQGNYRRVIFEGQAQVESINVGNINELSYILGLSYLKEGKLNLAEDCFRRILSNQESKFKFQAALGLADTFLIGGRFQEAEECYNKLISEQPNSIYKAAVLYRLSQLEFKRGNNQKGNDYLSKLRRDFPLSPELRLSRGIEILNRRSDEPIKDTGEYSVQVGFFSNSSNAGKLKDRLLAKGFPAYIESSVGGYRVRVGKFKTQKEAFDLESKLSRVGFPTKVCQ
jgi:tetratricopeptide (TPR) repeat protein